MPGQNCKNNIWLVWPWDGRRYEFTTTALDTACEVLPSEFKDNANARRRLAFRIIRLVDDGERDPQRIADAVIASLNR